MTLLIILSLLLASMKQPTMGSELNEVLLESVTNHFKLKHPLVFYKEDFMNLKLMKMMMNNDYYSSIVRNLPHYQASIKNYPTDLLLIVREVSGIQNIFNFMNKMNQNTRVIIISENMEHFVKSVTPTIDMQVFFVKESSMEVYEWYKIGRHEIRRKLGQFDKSSYNFNWEIDVIQDFLERRSNFQGLHLKAMTESNGNELILKSGYQQSAYYYSNNETYLVTNYASGLYHDILKEVQSQLNFTTSLYKRKVVAWGLVYPLANGSFDATGMVGDLYFQRVDLVVASLTIIKERALYIDMLMPIASENVGLYIQSQNSKGTFDFGLLFSPFR